MVDAKTLRVSSSERKDVAIPATGTIAVKGSVGDTATGGTRGGTTQVGTLGGDQTINNAVDASGSDITVRAIDLDIRQTIRSAGAVLNPASIDPGATIVIGNIKAPGSTGDDGTGWWWTRRNSPSCRTASARSWSAAARPTAPS
ncbi:hypothetical protein HK414_15955 [Ramlibacter terrae]|uniref:Uncharacterized protein n=1 Tax=Ramlibacter terrae TaxID=2732511 RepID=A0ABX6P5J5_9BURK|nr:hypothetical protein HK414_15955 [Ramlibacter terrae]